MATGNDQVKQAFELVRMGDEAVLKENYLNEEGVYHLEVDLRKSDPFDPYAGTKALDPSLFTYVDSFRKAMVNLAPIAVDFIVEEPKEETDRLIEEAFRRHYRMELCECQRERKRLKIISVVFMIVGALLLAVAVAMGFTDFGIIDDVIGEIVSIAAWVFVWAAVEKVAFDLRDLKKDALYNAVMSLTDISFKKGGESDAGNHRP